MAGYAAAENADLDEEAYMNLYEEGYRYRGLGSGQRFQYGHLYEQPDSSNEMTPPPVEKVPQQNDVAGEQVHRLANLGVGFGSLVCEYLLSHPCIVLRRQCQVHAQSYRYHLTPFTIMPVMINIQARQGISTMWKGIGSLFIVRGITLGCEDVLSKVTPLPKEVSRDSSFKSIGQHLFLKFIGFGLSTPFYSASLVETVQSDIASEKPGIFDVVKEGFLRLCGWGTPKSARLLPVWILVGPTALYGVMHYVITCTVQHFVSCRIKLKAKTTLPNDPTVEPSAPAPKTFYREMVASCIGNIVADTLLFPMETVLHRIHLQGTRTIIDNLDSGCTVLPIITQYEGPLDCFHTIVKEEGSSGLYKGFGALILQYAIQAAILRMTKFIYDEVLNFNRKCK